MTSLVCSSCGKPAERTFDDDFQHETTADGLSCTVYPVLPRRADPWALIRTSDDEYAGTELALRDSEPATGEGWADA